jgi:hypothetical protein
MTSISEAGIMLTAQDRLRLQMSHPDSYSIESFIRNDLDRLGQTEENNRTANQLLKFAVE